MRCSQIGISVAVVFVLLAGIAVSEDTNQEILRAQKTHSSDDLFLHDKTLRLYWPASRACGAVAAYIALSRMGHAIPFEDIIHGVPVSSAGTTMAELADYLKSQGVEAEAIEIN